MSGNLAQSRPACDLLPTAAQRLSGKTCIVTGGGSGIGRAISCLFASHGANVFVVDISQDVIEGGVPTTDLIRSGGGSASFINCDVSSAAAIESMMMDVTSISGRLDVMVNNACRRHQRRLTDLEDAEWDKIMAVNLTGVFLCCRAAVKQMLTQSVVDEVRGRIINLSSQHGMIAAPGDLAYGVSKAGVTYLTRQIAADYARDMIVCNGVAPGKIVTGQGGHLLDEAVLDRAYRRTPWPRLGTPSDVAKAALFLASDDASFVTGENLMVDGGWMAA